MPQLTKGVGRALLYANATYEAYINSLGPLLWYAMTGTGATEVNKGTVGATLDGTIANMGAQAIAGKIGANSAHLSDADASVITPPSVAALVAETVVQVLSLFSLGEAGLQFYVTGGAPGPTWRSRTDGIRLLRTFSGDNVDSQADFSDRMIGKWGVYFSTLDGNGDKTGRVYRYTQAGGFEEASYAAQVPGTGTIDTSSVARTIWNNSTGTRTVDGLGDEFLSFDYILSTSQMERIGRLALARRWSSYSTKILEMN